MRLQAKFNVENLCTDKYEAYCFIEIAKKHHRTKAETALIEVKNSIVRHYLARFNRRTKRFSKATDMIKVSLDLLFYKKIALSIIF